VRPEAPSGPPQGIGVTVARLILVQLVKVRILDPLLPQRPPQGGLLHAPRPSPHHSSLSIHPSQNFATSPASITFTSTPFGWKWLRSSVSSGHVPQWMGIATFGPMSWAARAPCSGPMVKRSPTGIIATCGRCSSPISYMSPNSAVSPQWYSVVPPTVATIPHGWPMYRPPWLDE